MVQLSHPYMTTGKTMALTTWTFVSKVMSLLFNTLSRFVIAFLPRSSHFLISWLQSPSAMILESKERKSVIASTYSPICHEVMGPNAMILVFLVWVLNWLCYSPSSPSSRGSLVSLCFLPFERYHRHMWGCWCFSRQSWFQLVAHPAQRFAWCTLYKLNKQGDSIQTYCTPFSVLN